MLFYVCVQGLGRDAEPFEPRLVVMSLELPSGEKVINRAAAVSQHLLHFVHPVKYPVQFKPPSRIYPSALKPRSPLFTDQTKRHALKG
jgi:hypothetical protein